MFFFQFLSFDSDGSKWSKMGKFDLEILNKHVANSRKKEDNFLEHFLVK